MEKITKKLTGLVNLFIVLLKLDNKIKINKDIPIGIKGIRIDKFIEFPTEELKYLINLVILYYFKDLILLSEIYLNLKCK